MFRSFLTALVAGLLAVAGPVAADESALNKEGFWTVGRGESDSTSCLATLEAESGEVFMLHAENGALALAVGGKRPLKGRRAAFSTEAYSFSFTPAFGRGGVLVSEEEMNESSIAALRLAREIAVKLDGRVVFSADVENTGLEGALDAVIACSKGQQGWWGAGVASPATADVRGALNPEGFWRVRANAEEESCTAYAAMKGGPAIVLVTTKEGTSFGVSANKTLKQGRKGLFSTEAYAFDFEPSYDDNYLYLDGPIGQKALAALRLARVLRISVDGRRIADMTLEGSGVDGVLDALVDCASGQDGWWGPGLGSEGADAAGSSEDDAGDGSGTGFFISADGLAMTAAHVVANCKAVESPRWGAVKVVALDKRADLAILKTSTSGGQFLMLRDRGPRLGESLTAGGYPLGGLIGSGLKITTGVVSGLSGPEGDRSLVQISAQIQPGNSGGPVVDANGRLIGVTVSKLDEVTLVRATGEFPQNINFAVPVTLLQAFLDENGVAYRTVGGAGAPNAPAAAPLTSVTFSLICRR